MKVKMIGKLKAANNKKVKRERNGQWTEDREKFVALKSVNLLDSEELEDSIMVCHRSRRPYLSRTATAEGIKYLTLPYGKDQMVVLRYKLKERKAE